MAGAPLGAPPATRAGAETPGRGQPPQQRYLSIDILRAAAILLMIQVHFCEHLSSHFASPRSLYALSQFLGNIPAPLFVFLSGLSYALWLASEQRSGKSAGEIVKYGLRRGMFVFALGIAVMVFIWLPGETFDWDILTLLGTAAVVLTAVRNWHPAVLIGICAVIVLASPPLRDLVDYDAYWLNDEFQYDYDLDQVLLGFFLNGYFPLLPWLVYALAGLAIGKIFYPPNRQASLPLIVPFVGIAMFAAALIAMLFEPLAPAWLARYYLNEWPEDFYPATTVFVLGSLGAVLVGLWVLNHAIDLNKRISGSGAILGFFRRYSYFALTAYVVHLAAQAWPMWITATWQQKPSTKFYFGQAVSTPMALALALGFIIVFYVGLVFWDRHRKYSLEYFMRWICD